MPLEIDFSANSTRQIPAGETQTYFHPPYGGDITKVVLKSLGDGGLVAQYHHGSRRLNQEFVSNGSPQINMLRRGQTLPTPIGKVRGI